jgi:hypothetical protein
LGLASILDSVCNDTAYVRPDSSLHCIADPYPTSLPLTCTPPPPHPYSTRSGCVAGCRQHPHLPGSDPTVTPWVLNLCASCTFRDFTCVYLPPPCSPCPHLNTYAAGASLVVDNTFTPLAVTPSHWGADVVVHSLTKFVSGASDIIAGAVCGSAAFVASLMDLHMGECVVQGAGRGGARGGDTKFLVVT